MLNLVVIFMPMFVSAFLVMVLVVEMLSEYHRSRMILLSFLLACSFLYLAHTVYFLHNTRLIPVSDSIYNLCSPMVFPLFYLYVSELVGKPLSRTGRRLWLLPSVLCCVLVSVSYIRMNSEEMRLFIAEYLYGNHFVMLPEVRFATYAHLFERVVFNLQIIPIFYLGARKIISYERLLKKRARSSDSSQQFQVRLILILFFIASIASGVSSLLGRYRFVDHTAFLAIPSVMFSLLIFLLGYIGIRFDVSGIIHETRPAGRNKSAVLSVATGETEDDTDADGIDSKSSKEMCMRIEQLMRDEQLFLQCDLKISDVVMRLGTNRSYIYNAVNREMGLSFSDYVNRMRIDYAAKMMTERPELQMNELYLKVGYNSSSSFYRNFKNFKGCTPKEFYARLHGGEQEPAIG